MSIKKTELIIDYWKAFIENNKELDYLSDYSFDAWSFGNTREMANELGRLVLQGKKTATCSLLRAYRGEENEIPRVGVYSVLCDGNEKPIGIVYLTNTWICKYSEVTQEHAFEEGEGDRTLGHWRKVHQEFFSSYEGFHNEDELICERFRLVHQ